MVALFLYKKCNPINYLIVLHLILQCGFSINLKFYDDSSQKEKSTFYSYSIFFDDKQPVEVETFLHKNISYLLNIDVLKMKSHLDWIDKTFNIKAISLMKIKNFILKNKSFDFNNLQ